MKSHFYRVVGTRGAFQVAIVTALIAGAAAPVPAQMKKEGTFSGTWNGGFTCKSMAVGKERLLLACDENSFTITDGFLDHLTWHCWGFSDWKKGMGAPYGACVGTDPSGDQIYGDFVYPTVALSAKSAGAKFTFTGGTGKYAGISGGFPYVQDFGAFRTGVEGTFVSHATFQGSYKLP
jgi:hypothetical protein